MSKRLVIASFLIVSMSAIGQAQSTATPPLASQRTLIDQYCAGCHNEKVKSGNLALTSLDLSHIDAAAPQWEKVVRKLRSGMMPPAGIKRPDKATLKTFITSLETALDQNAAGKPNPGRTAVH